eukprot:CAMPEP_0174272342 /NCGR_PEP_ID=MMETSP0439-20130205/50929_1 /TAXON_ID=0 /ORGANISM="Stereomyxa ramosa, Strain Chinc5" /LENGTH=154 /DNA_ID=CAMNT_0015362841 /DNA_START=85 /DNA_END=546 /DNA_ORIENTATION=+
MGKVKCVVVGDKGVGKTSLVITYLSSSFPDTLTSVSDSYSSTPLFDGYPVSLLVVDTNGQEEYFRLRSQAYEKADVVVLCFSVANPRSFRLVEEQWHGELTVSCPDAKRVLVGLKTDLRSNSDAIRTLADKNQSLVCRAEGQAMAEKIGAVDYV